jgi:hypothetical protein
MTCSRGPIAPASVRVQCDIRTRIVAAHVAAQQRGRCVGKVDDDEHVERVAEILAHPGVERVDAGRREDAQGLRVSVGSSGCGTRLVLAKSMKPARSI